MLPFPDTGADAGDGAGPLATLRADLAALREAYRQFVHLSVAPVGKAVAAELALKLDMPGLAFDRSGLMAADVAGKARAFQALTGGGRSGGIGGPGYGENRVLL